MKGAPLEDVADLLRHKSLWMTRRYAHLGPNKLTPVQRTLRPVARKLSCRNHFRGVAQW